jgi:hypothetical protein
VPLAVPFRPSMSVEGWIASVTGIFIAVGTGILVVYTPFGPAVRRAGSALVEFLRPRLGQVRHRLASGLRGHRTGIIVTSILVAAWSLALPALFGAVAAHPLWAWTARAIAGAASVLACVLAFKSQAGSPVVDLQMAPQTLAVESNAQELANRRLDLLRQAFAAAAAMLKYIPTEPKGRVSWDDVQQFNQLIYQLLAVNADVKAFEISFAWTFEIMGSGRQVDAYRVARQLEGLITYARSTGVGLPSAEAEFG